ncbi:MAG: MetQ/NlpA family ABC transporter substrate-binding protein [Dermatophilus congolensis]|nr:MetQ/NlpA family ABC transporter substrate-binding protein [Dermatophilus congolensis]
MNIKSRFSVAAALLATAGLGLAACGNSSSPQSSGGTSAASSEPLTVMADVKPHAELIKKAQEDGLLGDVKVEVTEISGQIDPNKLVQDGDMDANFFQHVPYLKNWNAENKGTLVDVGAVHVEPLGLYSKKVETADLANDSTIAIPQDPTNLARGLFLLSDAGLLTMDVKADDPNLDYSKVTTKNVTGNPKNITFIEIDRPQLAATLDDPKVAMSIVNGNYALEAGLTPETDAKFLEKAANNPYANVLVTSEALKDDPRVKKLAEALTSQQIKDYIKTTYKGSVLPAE